MPVPASEAITIAPKQTVVFDELRQLDAHEAWPDPEPGQPLTVAVTLRRCRRVVLTDAQGNPVLDGQGAAVTRQVDMTADQAAEIAALRQAAYDATVRDPYNAAMVEHRATLDAWTAARAAAKAAGESFAQPRPAEPATPPPHKPFTRDVSFTVPDLFKLMDPTDPGSSPEIAALVGQLFTLQVQAIALIGAKQGVI